MSPQGDFPPVPGSDLQTSSPISALCREPLPGTGSTKEAAALRSGRFASAASVVPTTTHQVVPSTNDTRKRSDLFHSRSLCGTVVS